MKPIGISHDSMERHKNFPPFIPPIIFKNIPVENLMPPPELFDEKTPTAPVSEIEALIPLVVAKSKMADPYIVVDGCKRFRNSVDTGKKECACGVFSDFLTAKSIGLLRILFNQNREKTIRESVCFFKWLNKNCEGNDFEATLDFLGFNPSLRLELQPLLTCADIVLNAVNDGRLAARAVPDLCLMDEQDQEAFLEILHDLTLSRQTQREFLEWLTEIAYSRKTSIRLLLQSADIQKIISDKILNSPQKIEALRELLHSWKYPLYDEALKKWKKLAATTSRSVLENEPSSKVVFVPNPAFEINKLEIRITINHAPAAKELFQRLSALPQTTWSQLIYPVEH